MAAKYITKTYTPVLGHGVGQQVKNLVALMCAMCPDIEIVEVETDTDSQYSAYIKVLGYDDIIFCVRHSNVTSSIASLIFDEYLKNATGTVTVASDLYKSIDMASQSGYLSTSQPLTYTLECVHEQGVYVALTVSASGKSNNLGFVGFRAVELCSGATRTAVALEDTGKALASCKSAEGGSYITLPTVPMLRDATDNGYVRMHPTAVCGSAGFIGTLCDPALVYAGYSAGAAMELATYTPFSVGGINFVSLGGNMAIRVE